MAHTGICDIGIIGLAVMGSNLALNIAEKGFRVAVHNRTYQRTVDFLTEHQAEMGDKLVGFEHMTDFVQALKVPRKVLILVQAGAATDATIEKLCPLLEKNDIIVDTGNAHFRDQDKRAAYLEAKGLRFLGMGISGGEEGARKGPAFFPGGTLSVWEEIRPIIEAASAKACDGLPCVTMNGSGGAGSCVKMYHNAGEYAVLQIWAEIVGVLIDYFGNDPDRVIDVLETWKQRGTLDSYMLTITIETLRAKEGTERLYTKVLDMIGSKGTGLWAVVEALESGIPVPSLVMAVTARQMSMQKQERSQNAASCATMCTRSRWFHEEGAVAEFPDQLYHAALLAILASYAQMFQCLRQLDVKYKFGLNLPATIATFRSGCILQGYLLQPMTEAFRRDPNISNLMCAFESELATGLPIYRKALANITQYSSIPIPVLSTSLEYIHTMFHSTLQSAQIIQLQRDIFGRHGFQRLDQSGTFNHTWPALQ